MSTSRRRQPKKQKKAPRQTAPPRRERTRSAPPPPPQRVWVPLLPGEELEVKEKLTRKVLRRRGRPPGRSTNVEAWAEHLQRYPDGTMEDGTPLGAKRRADKLWAEQRIRVDERTVRRWRRNSRG